jgi:hypothetical protein
MTNKNNYLEKLKDPRWQKKRLGIFERDEWTCQSCCSDENTLTVHHKYYIPDREPWDYPDDLLITLCEDCHKEEQELISDLLNDLPRIFLSKFLPSELKDLMDSVVILNVPHIPAVFISALCWHLDNDARFLVDRYFEKLKNERIKQNNVTQR